MPKTLKIELSRIISCWNHETWSKINEQRVGSSLLEIVGDTKISKQSVLNMVVPTVIYMTNN